MFVSLSSGSSGNSYLLSTDNTTILIDAGITAKKLELCMKDMGISPDKIDAIVLSHEHIDHVKGAGIISKKYNLPVFATEETLLSIKNNNIPEENMNFIKPDKTFSVGSIEILPFSVPHDAVNPVGYTFKSAKYKYSVATDIGKMNDNILNAVKGSIAIVLESNYDTEMLKNGKYSYYLKQRILGSHGHLSNSDAAQTALELVKNGTKYIMLGHLSRENNTPQKAVLETANYLLQYGISPGKDISLRTAAPFDVTDFRCEVISH